MSAFFKKRYDIESYNCGHFVVELWEHLTGENIDESVASFRKASLGEYRRFHAARKRIPSPVSPCLVVMRGVDIVPHVGVFLDDGVIHITTSGVRKESIASLKQTQTLSYFE